MLRYIIFLKYILELSVISLKEIVKLPSSRNPTIEDFHHLCSQIRVSDILWASHEHNYEVHEVVLARKKSICYYETQIQSWEYDMYLYGEKAYHTSTTPSKAFGIREAKMSNSMASSTKCSGMQENCMGQFDGSGILNPPIIRTNQMTIKR